MNIVYMAKSAWTGLLDTIRSKAGVTGSMTVSQAADAVESISGGDDGRFDALVSGWISGEVSTNAERIKIGAFAACNRITDVNMPNTTDIGNYAFSGCFTMSGVSAPSLISIGEYAFSGCANLASVSFPNAKLISARAFTGCTKLSTVYAPVLENLGAAAFYSCGSLSSVDFPLVLIINSSVFSSCSNLSVAKFNTVHHVGRSAFYNCYRLKSLYLLSNSVASLAGSNAFTSTPIDGYTAQTGGVYGSIYVPASLFESYKTATNWSYFSSRFVSV